MSFGLGRGRQLDPGAIGITADDLGPLPDDILTNPDAAKIDPRTWFPEPSRPLEIEIGSGKGTFLLQAAAAHPETNYLGIEWAREFYQYAADRCRRRWGGGGTPDPEDEPGEIGTDGDAKISRPEWAANVRLLNADAVEFLHWRCPDGIARVIHLYFSDPWPKSKHHRRRVVQDRFLADAHRILQPGGELRIVTDHEEYWAWMEEHFDRWAQGGTGFRPVNPTPTPGASSSVPATQPRFVRVPFTPLASAPDTELVGTNFERKYRREGRPFHAAILLKPTSYPA
jgi:tRNA (guanine-N7-)-methyltransferase